MHFVIFSGQTYLSWAFSQKEENPEEGELEDAKTRKKRLNLELARALAVLGQSSRFCGLVEVGLHFFYQKLHDFASNCIILHQNT